MTEIAFVASLSAEQLVGPFGKTGQLGPDNLEVRAGTIRFLGREHSTDLGIGDGLGRSAADG